MKLHWKGFLPGFLSALLIVGLLGTASAAMGKRSLEVDYKNIHLVVNNKPTDLFDAQGNAVEPFAYNGTTYIPVRAVSEALGHTVEWHDYGQSASVVVNAPTPTLNYSYQSTSVPRFENIVGYDTLFDFLVDDNNPKIIDYMYVLDKFKADTKNTYYSDYSDFLSKEGFTTTSSNINLGKVFLEMTNAKTNTLVSLMTVTSNGIQYVNIHVDASAQKGSSTSKTTTNNSSSSSSSSSSGNNSSSTPTPTPEPTPELDWSAPHHTVYGEAPRICSVCMLELRRVKITDSGVTVLICRDPNCRESEIPIYVMPSKEEE